KLSLIQLLVTSLLYLYIFFIISPLPVFLSFFFFNDTATTEIYTLSLHDALPIWRVPVPQGVGGLPQHRHVDLEGDLGRARSTCRDRKSTRLNSSHSQISYAVFCLKKKKKKKKKKEVGKKKKKQINGRK